MQPNPKWRFAIGTTSLVPNTDPPRHYLIVDVDTKNVQRTVEYLTNVLLIPDVAVFPTPRGWHVYTPAVFTWNGVLSKLAHVPHVDRRWLKIGQRRGYLFLADKTAVVLDWPVVRMVLHHRKATNGQT
jgi:hypothetical protein